MGKVRVVFRIVTDGEVSHHHPIPLRPGMDDHVRFDQEYSGDVTDPIPVVVQDRVVCPLNGGQTHFVHQMRDAIRGRCAVE